MIRYRLLLETSSRTPIVALADDQAVIREVRLEEDRRNARDLVPTIGQLLEEVGQRPRDLAGILVGLGPGSYTSLRVGLMTAKTLSYAVGCPLIGVPTMPILAYQAGEPRVEVIVDAQKDQLYVQSFADGRPQTTLRILKVAAWLAARDPVILVTGPGLSKISDPSIRRSPQTAWLPSAAALLAVGSTLAPSDPFSLLPLYLRPSAAEQQWEARGKL
ncbi:MAG: tRNA (adenosine(37)-N6)-threonylcarbamoyltransferase complex dimerization subunit type 1 TsaB [Gemmataceae bacterium]